uniref:Uncharacterized protein n=1 Tax=Sarcophilus harrisii TaxID=9305 RepID=A0A7N4PRW5_SARHA
GNAFRITIFQGLPYIQEFYEVTLLNSQKTCEQKIQEANQVAEKLERKTFLVSPRENLQKASAEVSFEPV